MSAHDEMPLDEALYAIGRHLLAEAQTREAAEVFRSLILNAPCDERGWLGLSECHRARGENWIGLELLGMATLFVGKTAPIETGLRLLSSEQTAAPSPESSP